MQHNAVHSATVSQRTPLKSLGFVLARHLHSAARLVAIPLLATLAGFAPCHQRKRVVPMTQAQLLQQFEAMTLRLAAIEAENAAMKEREATGHATKSIKVGPSGTIVLKGPGYGRFGVSVYKSVCLDILARAEEIKGFIALNDGKLSQGKQDKDKFAETKLAALAAWNARTAVKA